MATYAAEQRIKEIGVRKVLGASVFGITTLLSKDFLKLVLIASGVAFPIAWWATDKLINGCKSMLITLMFIGRCLWCQVFWQSQLPY